MSKAPKLVKLTGEAGWCALSEVYHGRVTGGVLRDGGDTLVLDLDSTGFAYMAKLVRQAGDHFTGTWSRNGGAIAGPVSATLYHSSEGDLLMGEWTEANTRYQWWVMLRAVD